MRNFHLAILLCYFSCTFTYVLFNGSRGNLNDTIISCVNNVCNSTAAYPESKILEALSKDGSFKNMFGTSMEPKVKIFTRFNGGENMCPSTAVNYSPRFAVNVKDELKKIVNVGEYNQYVVIQTCDNNAQCFSNPIIKNDNVELGCQTQYVTIRLVVFNDDGTLDVDNFSMPAGCYCSYKQLRGEPLSGTCNNA